LLFKNKQVLSNNSYSANNVEKIGVKMVGKINSLSWGKFKISADFIIILIYCGFYTVLDFFLLIAF